MTLDTRYYREPEKPGEYGSCGDGRDECIRLDFFDVDPGDGDHDD